MGQVRVAAPQFGTRNGHLIRDGRFVFTCHNLEVLRSPRMMGAKGKVSEDDGSFDRMFWAHATGEEHIAAMFHLRELYHEVMHPGSGAERLDRTIGGTRRLRD